MQRIVAWLVFAAACSESASGTAGDDDGTAGGEEGTSAGTLALPPVCPPFDSDEDPLSWRDRCDDFRSNAAGIDNAPIEIQIINAGSEAIIVRNTITGCGQTPRYFAVEGQVGPRRAQTPTSNCPAEWESCDWVIDPDSAPCLLCLTLPPPMRIPPGERLVSWWGPFVTFDADLPPGCGAADETHCRVWSAAPLGDYRITATAAPESSCPHSCHEPRFPGDEAGVGVCPVEYWSSDCEFSRMASASWDGSCGSVAIVFEDP
ncbi:MAG: hypothetical protein U0168_30805 [Nannocystaceae bacterium]